MNTQTLSMVDFPTCNTQYNAISHTFTTAPSYYGKQSTLCILSGVVILPREWCSHYGDCLGTKLTNNQECDVNDILCIAKTEAIN